MTCIVRRYYTVMDLMKTIQNFVMAFKREYNGRFVARRIVGILTNMIGSDILTGLSAQSYYRYFRAAKMTLRDKSVLPLAETLVWDIISLAQLMHRGRLAVRRSVRNTVFVIDLTTEK